MGKFSQCVYYLNVGTGVPCAGQAKLKAAPSSFLKIPRDSETVENFGLDDPIGSVKSKD